MSADQIERAQRVACERLPAGADLAPRRAHLHGPGARRQDRSSCRPASSRTGCCGPGKLPPSMAPTPAMIAGWKRLRDLADYPGLGIACGAIVGADIDIRDTELAAADRGAGARAAGRHAAAPGRAGTEGAVALSRRGRAAIKAMTDVFLKDDLKAQVEFMASGQQVVGYGIHPDTSEPYTWSGETPDTVPAADLPAVTQEQVAALVTRGRDSDTGGRLPDQGGDRGRERRRRRRRPGHQRAPRATTPSVP